MARPKNPEIVIPLERDEYQDDLSQIRNLWEFANLMQFVSMFKSILRMGVLESDLTIEVFEEDLLGINNPPLMLDRLKKALITGNLEPRFQTQDFNVDLATILNKKMKLFITIPQPKIVEQEDGEKIEIHQEADTTGLQGIREFDVFLKMNTFDYSANKFQNLKFESLNLVDQILLLNTLSRWMAFTDKFHQKLDELAKANSTVIDDYRILPIGWKGELGSYFLLDDNRLYFKLDFKPYLGDVIQPKADTKKRKRTAKSVPSSKKKRSRKIITAGDEEELKRDVNDQDTQDGEGVSLADALAREYEPEWSCVCWDTESWHAFAKTLEKSKDTYERQFCKYMKKNLLAVVDAHGDSVHRAAVLREKQRAKVALVATRKRSSRLEEKTVQKQMEEDERHRLEKIQEEELRHKTELKQRRKQQAAKEQRFLDRRNKEYQALMADLRFQWAREFAQSQQNGQNHSPIIDQSTNTNQQQTNDTIRRSGREKKSRQPDVEIEPVVHQARTRQQAKEESEEENLWYFDCACDTKGINYDDGSPSIYCERCSSWMHVACQPPVLQEEIERNSNTNRTFVCLRCREKEAVIRRKVAERYLRGRSDAEEILATLHYDFEPKTSENFVKHEEDTDSQHSDEKEDITSKIDDQNAEQSRFQIEQKNEDSSASESKQNNCHAMSLSSMLTWMPPEFTSSSSGQNEPAMSNSPSTNGIHHPDVNVSTD